MPTQLVFVIGTARSGTFMTSGVIARQLQVVQVNEINDFWKAQLSPRDHDASTDQDLTPAKIAQVRDRFLKRYARIDAPFLIEKTAANVLRLPLLERAFPEAKFVHIVRDGRDVALSIARKMAGNIAKVTKTGGASAGTTERLRAALATVRDKLRNGLTLRQLLAEPARYGTGLLNVLGLRRTGPWGVRFPGWRAHAAHHPPLEYGAIQWRECVTAAHRWYSATAPINRLHTLRYEDVLADPVDTLEGLMRFLEPSFEAPIDVEIIPTGDDWRTLLDDDQKQRLHDLIGTELRLAGYSTGDARAGTFAR